MFQPFDLNEVLQQLAAELDIPDQLYEQAISRYDDVAEWLGQEDSPLRDYSPTIYSQGSFRLGTVVRPFRGTGAFDIDLVCRLSIAKERTTQAELKGDVGDRLKANEELARILGERRRCWTLDYPGEFHLDVLPAIPDTEGRPDSILLTDTDLHHWQHSDPIAYANWFFERMKPVVDQLRESLAKAASVSIEEVPDWSVRTPLQRAVQLLKRHRDVHFTCEDERRPVSIIITTLAALAYEQERDIETAVHALVQGMPRHIELRNGRWWVENPAHPKENFADKWNEKPGRREAFLGWLRQVENDIGGTQIAKSTMATGRRLLRESFGIRDHVPAAFAKAATVSALPAEHVPQLADASHVETPRWPVRSTFKCRVRGWVHKSRKRALWELMERPVPKHFSLRFQVGFGGGQSEIHLTAVRRSTRS
jgi:hypothetical protein